MHALIFDLDGTLAETEDAHLAAFNETFAASGLDWSWDEPLYRDLLRVGGGRERLAYYLQRWRPDLVPAFSVESLTALHKAKTARYLERVAQGEVPLRPGIARLIAEARAAGLKVAICTTAHRVNVTGLLEATLGNVADIDVMATGEDVVHKKPAPDLYQVALRRLGLGPEQTLAIEDALIGLQAARAAGIPTVITRSGWSLDDVYPGAVAVLETLAEVSLDDLRRLQAQGVAAQVQTG